MQFLFVSTNPVVWLTSVPSSRLATLPLTLLQGVTPAHQGLSPVGDALLSFKKNYIYHSRRTQGIAKSGGEQLPFDVCARFNFRSSIETLCCKSAPSQS